MKKQIFYMTFIALLSGCNCYKGNILQIEEQGSFAVGGTVLTDSLGHKYHGDHAYVFYQKPVDARKYPLVFAHGVGQFSKTWETTPDGREGFQNIFLRIRLLLISAEIIIHSGNLCLLSSHCTANPDQKFTEPCFHICRFTVDIT